MAVTLNQYGIIYNDQTDVSSSKSGQKGVIAFGRNTVNGDYNVLLYTRVTNLGNVGSDISYSGSGRANVGGVSFGNDRGLIAYGNNYSTMINLASRVDENGILASEVSISGRARYGLAGVGYGGDRGILGYGIEFISPTMTYLTTLNLVLNIGAVATDNSGTGTPRWSLAGVRYGGDKGLFGFGTLQNGTDVAIINHVSNTGSVAADNSLIGTPSGRGGSVGAGYGYDKGVVAFGDFPGGEVTQNLLLINNQGTAVSSTLSISDSSRYTSGCVEVAGDEVIFAYGSNSNGTISSTQIWKLSNAGVVSASGTVAGQSRQAPGSTSYGS